MKLKYFFPCLFTILTLALPGHTQFIGIKGGVNWVNISANGFPVDQGFRTRYSAGFTVEKSFSKNFSLGADLLYCQRGFNSTSRFTDELGHKTGQTVVITFNYDYIALPLKVGLRTGNKLYGLFSLGLTLSILSDATTKVPVVNSQGQVIGEELVKPHTVTKFDVAGLLEIEGGYQFINKFCAFTSFRYQYSFTTISNPEYFKGRAMRHYGLFLSAGLKYALKN